MIYERQNILLCVLVFGNRLTELFKMIFSFLRELSLFDFGKGVKWLRIDIFQNCRVNSFCHPVSRLEGNSHNVTGEVPFQNHLPDGCNNCIWRKVNISNRFALWQKQRWMLKANLEQNLGSPVYSGHFRPVWETAVHSNTEWALLIFWNSEEIKFVCVWMCEWLWGWLSLPWPRD